MCPNFSKIFYSVCLINFIFCLIDHCSFRLRTTELGIWFPPRRNRVLTIYQPKLRASHEFERYLREYWFPSCRRMVLAANFEYHLPKVFREYRPQTMAMPGLWPFEISDVRCADGGMPQDLPNY